MACLEPSDFTHMDQYQIANCNFYVYGERLGKAIASMPGFGPFLQHPEHPDREALHEEVAGVHDETPVFRVSLSDTPFQTESKKQYTFQSDGVDSVFSATEKGYLLQMRHADGSSLDLWSDTASRDIYIHGDLLPQMLRFALWTAFGLMTVNHYRIPIHGSCIVNDGKAFLFLGESGTGKSTHTRLWREYISGSTLLNDDSPIIVAEADGIFIYGSPWSGKTPCYKSERYPLGGCVRLSQAPYNKMERLSPLKAYAALHPSCPPEFAYDETLYAGISQTLDKLLSGVGVFHLACLPDEAAAQLSHQVLTK